jgi:hypothetical protein
MAGYRALARHGKQQGFTRTEPAEIGDIEHGQYRVLSQNFTCRVLRARPATPPTARRTPTLT